MSIIKYILISIFINIYFAQETPENDNPPDFISDLTCGKSINGSPKKEKDCTKYGTGSGMLCCWVAKSNEQNEEGECYLLPASLGEAIKKSGGKKTFSNPKSGQKAYWSCGNKSYFLNIDIIMILLILFLF